MNQKEAIVALLQKRKMTMDQLVEAVAKKTKRSVSVGSLNVAICQLRAEGVNIVTYNRGDREKPTRYGIE